MVYIGLSVKLGFVLLLYTGSFTFVHLADGFVQSDYKHIQGTVMTKSDVQLWKIEAFAVFEYIIEDVFKTLHGCRVVVLTV